MSRPASGSDDAPRPQIRDVRFAVPQLAEHRVVIDPADTRAWIASGLKRLPPAPARPTKKYPYIDPW